MNKLFKKITVSASVLLILAFSGVSVFAEVFTEKTGGGNSESLYVAGNPDLYPIEYYDSESGTYKGLIPDMLSEVSKKTGISFTYILSGNTDERKSLYENNQVELVTSVPLNDGDFENMEKVTVFTAEYTGETVDYCIGFTGLLDDTQKESIIAALADISQSKKSGWLINNAESDLLQSKKAYLLLFSAVILIIAAAAVTVIVVLVKKRRRKIKADEMVDAETGVGNAKYYANAFENLISEQAKNLYNLAYFSFDVKRYDNTESGVAVKDIEKYAATRLSQLLNSREYLSRISDGVFVLLFQAENNTAADKRASDLVFSVNKYIAEFVNDNDVFKAGYCSFCDNIGIDAETAVYNAKQGYLYAVANSLPYYAGTKSQIAKNKKSEKLAAQIDTALEKGEFKAYLQLFANSKTSEYCGAEVLSRWQNGMYGLLRPDEYIGVLNETGKIVEHDYKIFEEVCAILERWSRPPFDKLFLSCNFTRLSVSNPEFSEKLAAVAEKYDFARNRLVVEITESSLNVNSKTVSENIKQLRKFGFMVAIDDMGAGFSSLADIYDNEVDIVKIERSFVTSCVTDRRRQMLRNIISLIHSAGARVICEGAETEQQVDMLKSIDCDIIQGFYYSRVLPFSECENFLKTKQEKKVLK